jgi:hypothetical protein
VYSIKRTTNAEPYPVPTAIITSNGNFCIRFLNSVQKPATPTGSENIPTSERNLAGVMLWSLFPSLRNRQMAVLVSVLLGY